MKEEIKVPSVGESITTGVLSTWLKQSGEAVKEGDNLFELETDKALIEVPSPGSGVLQIDVMEGTEVTVGQTVAQLDTEGQGTVVASSPEQVASAEPASNIKPLSPAVRRVVTEYNLDPGSIEGTGKDGRITKADALQAAEQQKSTPVPEPTSSGPAAPPAQPRTPGTREIERVSMTGIRKRTAQRLVEAKQNTAYLTTFNEIDMFKVMSIRAQHKESFQKEHGIKIGFMSFFVKACCQALKAFPSVNAQIDGDDIIYHHYYDIGVAISLERGLIVPIVRDADSLDFAGIESNIASLAQRARDKRLMPDELMGGTFSITNGGVFGSLLSTPIPSYPQTAILGMHTIKKRPVAIEDQVVVHPMMYVALTYDHRVIDGRAAVGFLAKVKAFIEEPEKLLLEL